MKAEPIEIFVSYARKTDEKTKIIDELQKFISQKRGIKLIVDKKETGYGYSIKKFMKRLGEGKKIIIVFDDAYVRSEWCMYELIEVWKNGGFEGRVYPIVVEGCDLHNSVYRAELTQFWQEKLTNEKSGSKTPTQNQHHSERLEKFNDIFNNLNEVLNFFSGLRYISLDELKTSNYSELKEFIQPPNSQKLPTWVWITVAISLSFAVILGIRNVLLNNKLEEKNKLMEKTDNEIRDKQNKEEERSRKDIEERLSMGENSFIDGNYDKRHGVLEGQSGRFSIARDMFLRSLITMKDDPEARIYYNNNRLKGLGAEEISVTIAVSVPIRRNVTVAKEILRGVAQAQQEENDRWDDCQNKSAAQDCQNVRPIQVLIASDDNDIEISKKIANNLVEDQKILAVIGHNASSVTKGVYNIYQEGRLTLITPTSYSFDHSQIDTQNNYIFATIFPVQVSLQALIDYITTEFGGNRKLLFCSEPGAHDETILKKPFNRKISLVKDAPNGSCDFGNKMGDILKYHMQDSKSSEGSKEIPTDLFLSSHVRNIIDSIILARESKVEKYRLSLYSTMTLYTKDALLLGGDDINEMILAVNWHSRSHDNDVNQRFINKAKDCWGDKFFDVDVDITWRTAMAYDATRTIIEGLKKIPLTNVKVTRKQLRDKIGDENFSFLGVTGQIEFKHNGERKGGEGHLVKVHENKFTPFVKQDNGKYELVGSKKVDSKDESKIKCEQ
ncbi:MAG: ABC transporter substrate-binding protein [Nitrosomonas sp.]